MELSKNMSENSQSFTIHTESVTMTTPKKDKKKNNSISNIIIDEKCDNIDYSYDEYSPVINIPKIKKLNIKKIK